MEANTRNLERIFDQTISYQIPLFQRPYVWSEEANWQPLWEDIQNLLDRYLAHGRAHPHFLGAVVFEQISNPTGSIEARQVIDGQQRLTTLQILLLAIRDQCAYLGVDKYVERFTDLVENKASRIDQEDEVYKVWPTNCDREAYKLTHGSGSPQKLSEEWKLHGRLTEQSHNIPEAYLYFSRMLASWLSGELDEEFDESPAYSADDRLETLWQIVRTHLLVVVIDLDKDDEAQVIFETLNARGTQLLPGDLIKNYLFHRASASGEEVEKLYITYWKEFDNNFWREEIKQGRLSRPRIDIFMQHYLTLSTLDEVKVSHIFNTFKYYAENYEAPSWSDQRAPKSSGEHLIRLNRFGKVFKTFYAPAAGSRLQLFLQRLEAVDTATVYPFLLMALDALEKTNPKELDQVLVVLESYLIRRMVCRLTTKNYNRFFLELVKAVERAGEVSARTVSEFVLKAKADSTKFPTDDELERALLEYPIYSQLAQYKVRAVLAALDRAFETGKSESLALPDGLTIEHVLPQTWQENWPLELDDPTDKVEKQEKSQARNIQLHTLGNLTLITGTLNPALSNSAWAIKRPELLKYSKLNLNRYFHDSADWDEEAIRGRGKLLAVKAREIWPYPEV
ncbi:MAG: DUF262 domain-containing HNH endonuclease family protein [Candidatus Thiodiazotropha endolucinida]|nr:DUF262 domain-containing HNH endonuclease family protein [Candidatus Thiodiazotropha taylori]MCW4276964.1 DUF262 domain-containing HNH endonuclease family protein [Candidatus Thiodiazotropha taylori]